MQSVLQDLRFALRQLYRNPAFALAAILVAAIGIGVNTTVFSLIDSVLLRPLPVAHPERLAEICTNDVHRRPLASSYPDYLEFRKADRLFSEVLAFKPTVVGFTEAERAEPLYAELVSANYFHALGLEPVLGREFAPDEDHPGAPPAAVLSYDFWQSRFGGDPKVVGRTILLAGHPVPIAGVAARPFKGLIVGLAADLWIPLSAESQLMPRTQDRMVDRGNRALFVKGRLRDGVSLREAQAGLTALARQIALSFPATNAGMTVTVLPASSVRVHPSVDSALVPLAVLLGIVPLLVLLIACSNVGNLLLVRAASRGREIGLRLAVGSPRGRIIRQLLTESALLAFLGGVLGLVLAAVGMRFLMAWRPPLPIPIALDLEVDGRMVLFTLFLSFVASLMFGLAPALHLSRPRLATALKEEEVLVLRINRRFGLRNVLVVTQVAVALVLLIGTGLFVRSLITAQTIDPGFQTRNLVIATPGFFLTGGSREQGTALTQRLVDRLKAQPGVQSVALASRVPLGVESRLSGFYRERSQLAEKDVPQVDVATVDGAYFPTLGVSILAGRGFEPTDLPASPKVAVVSQAAARRLLGTDSPVGRRFRLTKGQEDFYLVVGMARDTKVRTLGEAPRPYLYLPAAQSPDSVSLLIKTRQPAASAIGALRQQIEAVAPTLPILELKTIEDHLGISLYPPRLEAALLAVCGVLAVLLALLGLYGMVAYWVAQRTQEIGIRVALGADRRTVLALVVRQAMTLVAVGLLIGLVLALAAARPVASLLYGVPVPDPLTFLGVSGLFFLVAFLASYIPARRATSVDPMAVLRVG
jgi:predicted permease